MISRQGLLPNLQYGGPIGQQTIYKQHDIVHLSPLSHVKTLKTKIDVNAGIESAYAYPVSCNKVDLISLFIFSCGSESNFMATSVFLCSYTFSMHPRELHMYSHVT